MERVCRILFAAGEMVNLVDEKPVKGACWIREKMPLSQIPLFIRENSLIPRNESC